MLGAVKAIGFFPNSDHFLIFVTLSLLGFTMLTFTFLQLAILGKGGTNDPEKAKQTAQGGSFFSTLLIGLFALLFFHRRVVRGVDAVLLLRPRRRPRRHRSWPNTPSTLCDDTAPSARLVAPRG